MTVKRLLREMDGDELAHWMAYDSVSPIGDNHSDFLAAMICQTVGNRTGGKDGAPFKISEYLPDFWATEEQRENYPTPEELKAKISFIHDMLCELNAAKEIQNAGR